MWIREVSGVVHNCEPSYKIEAYSPLINKRANDMNEHCF